MRDTVYTLIKTELNSDGSVDSRTTHEFRTVALDEVLNNMTYFLRGCSFVIPEMEMLTLMDESEV